MIMAKRRRIRKRSEKFDISAGEPVQLSPVGSRYRTPMADIFGPSGYLDAILEVEAATALAISKHYPEKVPKADAARIKSVASTKHVKPERVQERESKETHHEMGAVIRELSEKAGKSGRYVHYTMTSADAVETGKALQLRKGLEMLIGTVEGLRDTCLDAAEEWRDTTCIMRTHGQQAIPASFGLPFAFFAYALNKSAVRLAYDMNNLVEGKISGAIGTYDVSTDEGMDGFLIEKEALGSIGVKPADVSMQIPPRENIAYIISDISVLCGRIESMAQYVKTLRRTEILELREEQEEGTVSSSAMPHKNLHGNPHAEERCMSVAKVVRGFAATALDSVSAEDYRDLTASLSDRVIIPEAFVLADYSCRLMESVINRVDVIDENVERNLSADRGAVTSQRIMSRLINKGMGRDEARSIVKDDVFKSHKEERPYAEILIDDPRIMKFLGKSEVAELGDPHTYIGRSRDIIDRTVSRYRGKKAVG